MLTLLEPVLFFPRLGNATDIAVRNDPPSAGGPKVLNSDFSDPTQRQKIEYGIIDAIHLVNVLLDGFKNEKDLFMGVYDKYFMRDPRNNEPHSVVMG